MVDSAFAQVPSTPTFSVNTVSSSNVTPTTYSNDPYTGTNITNLGYTVTTFNVTITVQNTPLTSAYLLEVKGHYSTNWYNPTIDDYNITAFASNSSQTIITLYGSNESESVANQIFLQYDGHWGIDVSFGGQVDFRLQAVSETAEYRVIGGWSVVGSVSDWSAVQTVTVPNFSTSTSTSPTPFVPEFPALIILPLFAVATLLSIVFIRTLSKKKL
jgi:hypothetical protein